MCLRNSLEPVVNSAVACVVFSEEYQNGDCGLVIGKFSI